MIDAGKELAQDMRTFKKSRSKRSLSRDRLFIAENFF